jgi:hypothetical protein
VVHLCHLQEFFFVRKHFIPNYTVWYQAFSLFSKRPELMSGIFFQLLAITMLQWPLHNVKLSNYYMRRFKLGAHKNHCMWIFFMTFIVQIVWCQNSLSFICTKQLVRLNCQNQITVIAVTYYGSISVHSFPHRPFVAHAFQAFLQNYH